ncbi:DUF2913 family protein [Vibrio maerlii]|uniref:DUF2913 family protein n=1 Tax=Vibrio maerlii TaxID=2231648 RepID=UPI000E3C852D|nr:DUF2913 family protein [Vibrio maerlii]
MSNYRIELQRLIDDALNDLEMAHKGGKVANTPVSNNLYLVRWVTKSLKQQEYARCVGNDLTRWQKQGRSKGNNSDLYSLFKRIDAYYKRFFPTDEVRPLKDSDIEKFLDQALAAGWDVSTAEPIIGHGKIQFFSEGMNSLALCADECDSCFDGGEDLVKPMHWFVRGHHAGFIEMAADAGFMVHKVTDYKSVVKYHGEYIVYPGNEGEQLAEIPLSFTA